MSNGNGCQPLTGCESTDGQINVVPGATGSAGIALNNNFKTLQYRQPKCNYAGQGEPGSLGHSDGYCVGSRWLDELTGTMWMCTNAGFSGSGSAQPE